MSFFYKIFEKDKINMDKEFWKIIKEEYKIGKIIVGNVVHLAPFGVFVDIGHHDKVMGLIQITEFLDDGIMTEKMYPAIGSKIKAVIIAFTEDDRKQIWLSVKPSTFNEAILK